MAGGSLASGLGGSGSFQDLWDSTPGYLHLHLLSFQRALNRFDFYRVSAFHLFIIFALLALVFRSYVQPIVVMFAIPLGLIGAVTGHLILDIPLSLLSIFGIIGLAGVVINNSLVMVDVYNEFIRKGMATREAVITGTKQRFRPILLTSLTTFLGVYPLIMETSLQAQFLIPLAVSIGYGVLIGTLIIVFTVPSIFMAQHHATSAIKAIFALSRPQGTPQVESDEPSSDEAETIRLVAAE